MDLLSLLTGTMTSGSSVKSAKKKTSGASKSQVSSLITMALPILLKSLTSNASSEGGLASLLGALGQHTSKKTVSEQIEEADEEDGSKIIGHILGDKNSDVVSELAKKTGMTKKDVSKVLDNIAPALMSEVSAVSDKACAKKKKTVEKEEEEDSSLDLTDVMSMFGGNKSGGLLSSLFGGTSAKKKAASSSAATDIIGSLLGGADDKGGFDGTQLLTSLLSGK